MTGSPRASTGTFDGGGNSLVEQTTDIFTRFRNSLIRSRKERLIDEDVQATANLLEQIHLTEFMAKETLGKLISQGDSMQRSYSLINRLEKEIKEIAEDLNEVNGGKCWGACANGTFFGFACLGCVSNKSKKKNKRKAPKKLQTINARQTVRWSSTTERDEILARIRAAARDRREQPDFVQTLDRIRQLAESDRETAERKVSRFRDYLLQHHSLTYGYIDQPERLFNEINMAIHMTQLNSHLDNLLQITDQMTNEVNQHNVVITKIESQAMQSGDLLTDYTLLGHQILGSTSAPPTTVPSTSNLQSAAVATAGQKMLLNSVL